MVLSLLCCSLPVCSLVCLDAPFVAPTTLQSPSSQTVVMCIATPAYGTQPRVMIIIHVESVVILSQLLDPILSQRIDDSLSCLSRSDTIIGNKRRR